MGKLKKGSCLCKTIQFPTSITHDNHWVKVNMKNVPDGMSASCIWTDGTDIYYSGYDDVQLVLNGNTWETKEWNVSGLYGSFIWTDGTDIYSSGHVLRNGIWEIKEWEMFNKWGDVVPCSISGGQIWTDGTDIYYSYNGQQYVLDRDTDSWHKITWSGGKNIGGESTTAYFYGDRVWTDGTNIYYCGGPDHKDDGQGVLNGDTWSKKTWTGLNPLATNVWTDGTDIYYSSSEGQFILKDGIWIPHEWSGVNQPVPRIWSDGKNVYMNQYEAYMLGGGPTEVYVLADPVPVPLLNPAALMQGYMVGQAIRRNRK